MKFLKKASQMLPLGDLRYLLHTHLNVKDPHRGVDHVHASELTKPEGFCPRFFAIAQKTNIKLPGNWLSTSETVTFWLGHALQDAVVNWFAEMGKAVGHWECLSCECMHYFRKRPLACDKCGAKVFKPIEARFISEECGAGGGIDMLVDLGQPKLRIVEIKTMAADQFKGLVAPLAEHKLRTNLYMRIVAHSQSPWAKMVDTERADVLYVSKSGYGCAVDDEFKKWKLMEQFSPFKVYAVNRDDKATEEIAWRGAVVQNFTEGVIGMPTGICDTAFVSRAKKCPACKQCFSGDFPAEYDWQQGG